MIVNTKHVYNFILIKSGYHEQTTGEHFGQTPWRERIKVRRASLANAASVRSSDQTNLCAHDFRSNTDSSVSLSAFAYLYSELVQYHQNRVDSISELERRLESSGYGIGLKILELQAYRSRDVRTFMPQLFGLAFWCSLRILRLLACFTPRPMCSTRER